MGPPSMEYPPPSMDGGTPRVGCNRSHTIDKGWDFLLLSALETMAHELAELGGSVTGYVICAIDAMNSG